MLTHVSEEISFSLRVLFKSPSIHLFHVIRKNPFLVKETLVMVNAISLDLVSSSELSVPDDASSMSQAFDAALSISCVQLVTSHGTNENIYWLSGVLCSSKVPGE